MFGHVGALVQRGDRLGLVRHLRQIMALLEEGSGLEWDLERGVLREPRAGAGA